jgi:hypothetical protein
VWAAFTEKFQQRSEVVAGKRRGLDQPQIFLAAFAGEEGKFDPVRPRNRGELVAAIAPPVVAAEDADQDHFGMPRDRIDPEVDRHRMAQVAQGGDPQRGQRSV